MSSELDNFLKDLKTDPTVESDKSFTLSEESALAKLTEFSFASEADHLLRLLQVAQMSGAHEVRVVLGGREDTVTWRYENPLPDAAQVRDRLTTPGDHQNEMLRHLLPALRDCLKRKFEWSPGRGKSLLWSGAKLELSKMEKGRSKFAHFSCSHSSFLESLFRRRRTFV